VLQAPLPPLEPRNRTIPDPVGYVSGFRTDTRQLKAMRVAYLHWDVDSWWDTCADLLKAGWEHSDADLYHLVTAARSAPSRHMTTVHHNKANGSQSVKTFKLTTCSLAPGETMEMSREHSFRPLTTRRYHPGPHAIALQVNSVASERAEFELETPGPAHQKSCRS
jgi:hypothetical protein